MAKEIHITLLKVEDLHHVWYREAASISCSEEVKKYHEMMEKLNELMDDDQAITHKVHHPAIGQFYAGRDVKERRWFRVKIKNLMLATKNGPTASCFRVDFADTVMIQFSNLRILPEEYGVKNIPKQAKEMAFYGLQPLTLVTDLIEMNTTPKPCFKWSVSAVEHVRRKVKNHSCKVQIMGTDHNGRHYVRLFTKMADMEWMCINDDLVELGYAVFSHQVAEQEKAGSTSPYTTETRSKPSSKSRTLNDFLGEEKEKEEIRQKQRQQYLADYPQSSHSPSLPTLVSDENSSDGEMEAIRRQIQSLEGSKGSDNINTTSQLVVTGGGDGIDQNTNLHQKPLVRPGGDSYESDSAVKQRITRMPYQSEAQPNMIGQGSGRSRLGAQRGSASTDTPQELFGTSVASSMVQSEKSSTSHQLRTGQTFEHSISNSVSGPTDALSQQVTDSHGKSSTRTSIPSLQSHIPFRGSSLLSTLKKLSPSKSNVVETTSVNSPGEMHPSPSLSTDLESPKSVSSSEVDSKKAETHAKPKMPSLLSALKSQAARQQVSGISHAQPSACNRSELSSGSPAVLSGVVEQANGNNAAMVMNKVEAVPQQDLTASHNSPVLGAEKETFSTRISPDKVPSNMQRSEPSSIMVSSKPPQKPMGRASMLINSLIMVNSPKVGLSVRDMDATVSPDGKRTSLVKVSSSDVPKTVFKQPFCSAVADCETSRQTEKQQEQSEDNLVSPLTQLAEKTDPDALQPEEQSVMEEQLTKIEDQISVENKTESEIPHDSIERKLAIENEMLNQPSSSDSSSASSGSSRKGKGNISWAEKPIIHTLPETPLVSQFPSEVYAVYRSVALETVSTETAQDGQSRQAQLSTQSPITQTQVAAQSVGGSGAISKRPTTARLPGVALQKQKKESQSPDILNTPSPPQIPGSSGKPLKSILKKRDSSVYFSDQESSPLNLPGDVVPSPRYSSSDSETLGNPGEQGTPERRILDEDLFSFFHGQHFGSPMLTQQARGLPQKDISEHGVLVDGERPSPPCLSVTDANFDDLVNRGLYDRKFGAPILVQAYVWRPMMRARHVVAVSPPRSGKTLAYLLPVISHILQRDTYKDVPAGNGPLALIVTPSWKKAQQVFDWCYDFLGGRPDAKTLIIYGGGSEEDQYIPLLNGCKILVATPYCLLRMIEKGYTNLNRLCHLVMDDADVLTEDFTDQVRQLMTSYTQVLRTVESSSRPQQIVMVGSQWTPGMASFKDTFMVDPLVIITSKLEASIYAGVKQSVYMCVAAQRDQQLLGILNTFVLQDKKAIIFTNSTRDAIDLSQVLKSQSMYVLVAHKELLSDQLEDIQKDWNIDHREGSKPLLILTDECIKELKLTNATCIIHFSLPDTKKAFVNRYGCMLENFKRSQQEEQIVLTSYIIITDQCTEQAQTVLQLLLRTKSYVPKKLQTMVKDVKKAKEEEKSKPLCHYLKSFGVCRERQRCEHRHVVVKEQDTPGISKHHISLPTSGEVKVLVTHVIDSASCFYVRLQELRSETEDSFKAMAAAYVQLVLDMNMWFQVKDNQIIQDEICEGTVCAVQDSQKCYHRVQITCIPQSEFETVKEVKVQYVDVGKLEWVPKSSMLKLPQHFLDVPFQAVEVYLCCIKPVDDDTEWTRKAVEFVHQLVEDKELEGRICLSLGNTLWLNPVVSRVKLQCTRSFFHQFSLRKDLLRNGLAVNNLKHLDKLYELCEGKVDIVQRAPKDNMDDSLQSVTVAMETEILPESEEYHEVYVASIDSPGIFHVQKREMEKKIVALIDEINEESEHILQDTSYVDITCGTLVLALFPEDDRWYRAQVLATRGHSEVHVLFVDYGEREWLVFDKIRNLPEKYRTLPFQAIECCLADLAPREGQWKEGDTDAFWDLVLDDQDQKIALVAKVINRSPAMYGGCHRYHIVLYDTESEDVTINIGDTLVTQGRAVSLHIPEEVIEEVIIGSKHYDYPYQKIPDLCAALQISTDEMRRLFIAKALQRTVMNSANFKDEIREIGGIRLLCGLLNQETSSECVEYLLLTLISMCANNSCNMEELRNEGGVDILCNLLAVAFDPSLQARAAWAIGSVAVSERNRSAVLECGGLETLNKLLEPSSDIIVQRDVTKAMASLVVECPRNAKSLIELGVIQKLKEVVLMSQDADLLEHTLGALSGIVTHPDCRQAVQEHGGVEAICKGLSSLEEEKVVGPAIKALRCLAFDSKRNKEVMIDQGLVPVLKKLCDSTGFLTNVTRRHCRDFLNKLTAFQRDAVGKSCVNGTSHVESPERQQPVRLKHHSPQKPKPQKLLLTPIVKGLPPLETTEEHVANVKPPVKWYQDSNHVVLKILVRGVEQKVVNFGDRTVRFSATVLDTFYHFDLELYENIVQSKCLVDVRGGEVLIRLHKATTGRWPRLQKHKSKPAYISLDFENYAGSSSEAEMADSEDESPFIPRRKAKDPFHESSDPPVPHLVDGVPPDLEPWSSESTNEEDEEEESSQRDRPQRHPEYFDL